MSWLSRPMLGTFLLLAALSGCASIELNRAMERLHNRYLDLFYQVENQDLQGIRGAADNLIAALDDSAITGYSSFAGFQAHLEKTRAVVKEISQLERFEKRSVFQLRGQLSRSCQACHKSYRK